MKIIKEKSGSILIITALLSIFLLSVTAIAIDLSLAYSEHYALQSAVDSAWHAGIDKILQYKSLHQYLQCKSLIIDEKLTNEEKNKIKLLIKEVIQLNINSKNIKNLIIEIDDSNNSLYISCTANFGTFFARSININSFNLTSSKSSNNNIQKYFTPIIPIAIPNGIIEENYSQNPNYCHLFNDSENFIKNNIYLLKIGEKFPDFKTNRIQKYYGIIDLNLNNFDNNDYEKYLLNKFKYGFPQKIDINDKVYPITGNYEKIIQQALDYASGSEVIVPIADIASKSNDINIKTIYDFNNDSPEFSVVALKIIGFAKFQLLHYSCFNNENYQSGEIKAKFLTYVVKPYEIN